MILQFQDQRFKTKKALYERLRDILWNSPIGPVCEEDAAFLDACLYEAHAHYGMQKENPIGWLIQFNAMYQKSREFVFIRADGSRDNPSIKRLARTKLKKNRDYKSAARREIAYQISEFRAQKFNGFSYTCDDAQCGYTSNNAAHFEVDHDIPVFVELLDHWIQSSRIDPTDIEVVDQLDPSGVLIDYGMGPEHGVSWRGFHKKYAKLQLLCKGCHQHKTARRGGE